MDVLITGAFGAAGTALLDALPADGYDVTCLDRSAAPEGYEQFRTVTADVADVRAIRPHFDGRDAVVHLAGCPGPDCSWAEVRHGNVEGTYAALEAARRADVGTFVFASSAHVVGLYEADRAPDVYEPDDDLTVGPEDPVRPDSLYAVSKLFGEHLGRYYVEAREAPDRCYAIRFAGLRSEPHDHPYGDAERGVDAGEWERGSEAYERAAARLGAVWISRRDFARLVRCCLRDRSVAFDVFYGASDNERCWYDVEHAAETLGFQPRDSADEWDGPPDRSEG